MTESLAARSVVLVMEELSPALPLFVYSVCAVDWAVDQPTGSWLAPARALASAAACTCRFCRYQPPTSITNPATPSRDDHEERHHRQRLARLTAALARGHRHGSLDGWQCGDL